MILKKHIAIVIAFLVLVVNSGWGFSVHYCDDRIASVSLDDQQEVFVENVSHECCGVIEKKTECCSDKLIKPAVKSDQVVVKTVDFALAYCLLPDVFQMASVPDYYVPVADKSINYTNEANAPPRYLLYHQLIFYC